MTMPAAARRRPTILVAEDDAGFRETVTTLLADSGYEAVGTSTGKAAIAYVREATVDIVLTDILMPDATGVDVLRAVRERQLDTPVILMTGDPSLPTAVQAIELGALRYLIKPVSQATLLGAVSEALGMARLAKLRREAFALSNGNRLIADRAGLEAVFARARAALWVAYQPIFWARDGECFGHEALLRAATPEVTTAVAFLDVAERLDRTADLGRQVREVVAGDLEGMQGSALVNLHPLELGDPGLHADEDPISRHADRVVLEVTERASLDGVGNLRERVRHLRARGFRIALDDLGAGYAALSSLASLEPNIVKVDMSIVRGIDQHPTKRKLMGSIVELCRDLGILVVAEGIETEGERDVLVDTGCDLLQGFLLGRPAPRAV